MNKKIIMAAGGSGGHIYPALALAKAMQEKGNEVIFIGSLDRMEKDVIPTSGFPFIGLDIKTTRGSIIQKFKSLLSLFNAYFKCLKLLKGADLVIGYGNYISVPVILAGKKLKIKTVIHEQNSYVGRANLFLDQKVDLVIGSYEENLKQFKNPNIVILGNPQSSLAASSTKDEDLLKELGLNPELKTVLIFFGSLGSESVNKVVLDYFKLTDGKYQIIYATGTRNYEEAKDYQNEWIKIVERIDGIRAMQDSTLLLSRAGATTIAEITAIGMPSILIPSPYVPNNHQYYNAKALSDKDAAILLEEKDLDKDKLKSLIENLLDDDKRREEISLNARKLGNPNVREDILDRLDV